MLTQEYLQNKLDYNTDTGIFKRKSGKLAGTKTKKGYIQISLDNKLYLAHRLAWLYEKGNLPKEIDHIDRNKSNNCINNLREVTRSQNMRNVSLKSTNTSGVIGVNYSKSMGKWEVRVQVNKQRRLLGYFEDLELAELVAIEARIKYHGEYAKEYR